MSVIFPLAFIALNYLLIGVVVAVSVSPGKGKMFDRIILLLLWFPMFFIEAVLFATQGVMEAAEKFFTGKELDE